MSADGEEKTGGEEVREQDKFLPIANISRIMKRALPHNAKISKDAKEAVQECVSEYISFITSEASDKCQREKRKTINGEDLLWAMTTLGFQDSIEALRSYLQKHRECEGEKSVKTTHDNTADATQATGMVPSLHAGTAMPAGYSMAYQAHMPPQMQPHVPADASGSGQGHLSSGSRN